MARTVAQRAVNNFTGGLVTEASPLSFPENSLSIATNFTLSTSGEARTRYPFNYLTLESSGELTSITRIKKYLWTEKELTVILGFVPSQGVTLFALVGNNWISKLLYQTTNEKVFDTFNIVFTDKYFYFTDVKNQVVRGSITSSINITSDYAVSRTTQSSEWMYNRTSQPYYYVMIGNNTAEFGGQPGYTEQNIYWNGEVVASWKSTGNTGDWILMPTDMSGPGGYTYHPELNAQFTDPDVTYPKKFYRVRRSWLSDNINRSTGSQYIAYRDFKGLPSFDGGGAEVPADKRPASASKSYLYNLLNAGWKELDVDDKATQMLVPLDFKNPWVEIKDIVMPAAPSYCSTVRRSTGKYPSTSESFYEYFADQVNEIEQVGLFSARLLSNSSPVSSTAKRGSNVLMLGQELHTMHDSYGKVFYPARLGYGTVADGSFSSDTNSLYGTKPTITAMAYINGRMWYGLTDRWFNIAYSKTSGSTATRRTDIDVFNECFQENDPTSEEFNQLIETDGGTINLDNIGTVVAFSEVRGEVVVFSTKGVWLISGSDKDSFSPTSFSIKKLWNNGVQSHGCVRLLDQGTFFISDGRLLIISTNEVGEISVNDLSSGKIRQEGLKFLKDFHKCRYFDILYDLDNNLLLLSKNSGGLSSWGKTITLCYSIALGNFFYWEGVNKEEYDTPILSLGFLQTDKDSVGVLESSSLSGIETLKIFSENKESDYLIDGSFTEEAKPFLCEIEIPYDFMGDPSINKDGQTLTVYLDADESFFNKTVSPDGVELIQPSLYLNYSWDWDTSYKEGPVISGNIPLPQVDNFLSKRVLINNIRLPGSGRCLTLNFKTNKHELKNRGASLLGYMLLSSRDNRP